MEFYGTYQFLQPILTEFERNFRDDHQTASGPLGNPRPSEFVTIQWVDVGSQNGDPRR